MLSIRAARRMKITMLTAIVAVGGTVFTSCGIVDLRHNLIAGTQAFVKGYTTDLWEALVPPADELINIGGGED